MLLLQSHRVCNSIDFCGNQIETGVIFTSTNASHSICDSENSSAAKFDDYDFIRDQMIIDKLLNTILDDILDQTEIPREGILNPSRETTIADLD